MSDPLTGRRLCGAVDDCLNQVASERASYHTMLTRTLLSEGMPSMETGHSSVSEHASSEHSGMKTSAYIPRASHLKFLNVCEYMALRALLKWIASRRLEGRPVVTAPVPYPPPASPEEVDVRGCTELKSLDVKDKEKLRVLNVSGCTNLKSLDLTGFVALQHLTASGCQLLESLTLDNLKQLISLDVSGCINLASLDLTGFDALQHLTVSGFQLLEFLNVSGCTKLKSLDVKDKGELRVLNVSGCANLESLTGDCRKLRLLFVDGCSKLKSLDVKDKEELRVLNVSGCTDLASLDLSGCRRLEYLNVGVSECQRVHSAEKSGCLRVQRSAYPKSLGVRRAYASGLYRLHVAAADGNGFGGVREVVHVSWLHIAGRFGDAQDGLHAVRRVAFVARDARDATLHVKFAPVLRDQLLDGQLLGDVGRVEEAPHADQTGGLQHVAGDQQVVARGRRRRARVRRQVEDVVAFHREAVVERGQVRHTELVAKGVFLHVLVALPVAGDDVVALALEPSREVTARQLR